MEELSNSNLKNSSSKTIGEIYTLDNFSNILEDD